MAAEDYGDNNGVRCFYLQTHKKLLEHIYGHNHYKQVSTRAGSL